MLEPKKRGNVAAVVVSLEKSRKTDFSRTKLESTDKENGFYPSVNAQGADDSSLEESTVKHTWSGSGSPAVLTSESDFSSTTDDEDDEEEEEKEAKRRSITKDCNSDFRWVPTERQQAKALFDAVEDEKKEEEDCADIVPELYRDAKRDERKQESNPFFSMDHNAKMLDFGHFDGAERNEMVQLRLPPQSPGSLDRKRLAKWRTDRDQKSKSSVITRPGFSCKKSLSKAISDSFSFQNCEISKRHNYLYPHEGWQQCYGEEVQRTCCQCHRGKCSDRRCCLDHHDYYPQHHWQCCQSPRKGFYGSCESLPEKASKKCSFGSQKSLMRVCDGHEQRKSLRKSPWRESHAKLFQASNEYLCQSHCCQLDGEKSGSWRVLGKSTPDLEEKLFRLENDKESLQLQVTVLTEQVEAQSEKISDLQQSLDDKKQQLNNAEDLFQREILSRSSLETQKLELMSTISELKLQLAAVERENYELREEKKRVQAVKPPIMPRHASPALMQSNRFSANGLANRKSANPFSHHDHYLSDTSNSISDTHHAYISSSTPNNNADNVVGSPGASPVVANSQRRDEMKHYSLTPQPNIRRSMDHYNSLPRQKLTEKEHAMPVAEIHRKGVVFAETEKLNIKVDTIDSTDEILDATMPLDVKLSQSSTKKGIKKIFNKIKRSNSGNFNDLLGDSEFRRGGIRATAGPRLGGPTVQIHVTPDKPFADWDTENLCNWMEDLGLENYVADLRRWVKNGSQLLLASPHDLEKELGMKNPLHKKKLILALQDVQDKGPEVDELLKPSGYLDTHWVLRWLDDVGLPQHKEVFLTARIDGRMLHRLTMDDLSTLHITSMLHVASLRRGIKVLREHKMDPNCLTRRSVPDEPSPTAADVALWTNHRVMEWLRIVDLAEYAPNLRGSGVHGALMVYETKFTAELLASLLNIPPNKTLLRRHLNTHFKELLGREVIQGKREAETTLGYIPLTPSAKVKLTKKPQFTLKRKKNKNELDYGDLVCPMEEVPTGEQSTNSLTNVTGEGMMKGKRLVPDVCPVTDPTPSTDSQMFDRLSRV